MEMIQLFLLKKLKSNKCFKKYRFDPVLEIMILAFNQQLKMVFWVRNQLLGALSNTLWRQ
jgi:hypothetical protein